MNNAERSSCAVGGLERRTITTTCVMVSCCGGAELQVVRAAHGDEEIVLRELYPDRSSLRARPRAAIGAR